MTNALTWDRWCSGFPSHMKTVQLQPWARSPCHTLGPWMACAREDCPPSKAVGMKKKAEEGCLQECPWVWLAVPTQGPSSVSLLTFRMPLGGQEYTEDGETKGWNALTRREHRGIWSPNRATQPDLGSWPAVLFGKRCQKADDLQTVWPEKL